MDCRRTLTAVAAAAVASLSLAGAQVTPSTSTASAANASADGSAGALAPAVFSPLSQKSPPGVSFPNTNMAACKRWAVRYGGPDATCKWQQLANEPNVGPCWALRPYSPSWHAYFGGVSATSKPCFPPLQKKWRPAGHVRRSHMTSHIRTGDSFASVLGTGRGHVPGNIERADRRWLAGALVRAVGGDVRSAPGANCPRRLQSPSAARGTCRAWCSPAREQVQTKGW